MSLEDWLLVIHKLGEGLALGYGCGVRTVGLELVSKPGRHVWSAL
jgi:hypothetical protein